MLKEMSSWLRLRPTSDDVAVALQEASALVDRVRQTGDEPSINFLKAVLHWAALGTQLPLEFVEQRLDMEVYGKGQQ